VALRLVRICFGYFNLLEPMFQKCTVAASPFGRVFNHGEEEGVDKLAPSEKSSTDALNSLNSMPS
jgi:hypothetical protein